ncbi:MAG: phosphoribosylglycinamide formyltransferase, partial [Actinobacteria bacterium]|nr:phosphoribosylglycinamide formyltransferase [Actinomycetota bacterium]
MSRVVALASGAGSVVQALLDAAAVADYPVDVVALVSDQPDAGALGRAEAMGIA